MKNGDVVLNVPFLKSTMTSSERKQKMTQTRKINVMSNPLNPEIVMSP